MSNEQKVDASGDDDLDLDAFNDQDVPEVDIEYQKSNGDDDCGDSCKI